MKKLLVLAAAVALTASAYGQGAIIFDHLNSGAIVTLPGGNPVIGAGYSGQLFAGPSSADRDSLVPVTQDVNGNSAIYGFYPANAPAPLHGYVNSQSRQVVVPGVEAGSGAAVQLRVWDNNGGALTSWEQGEGVLAWGESNIIGTGGNVVLGGIDPVSGNPVTPPDLTGLQPFELQVIPEPGTWALLGLGALALAFRRRK